MSDQEHAVLCVDDEENILRSLKRLLRNEGYRLLTASSGKEGLRILEENRVHLVISDQRMPGMNGAEFLAQVKERYPDTIRICLTGYTDVDSITESINKGHIYKFMLKPWNDQGLKLEIRQALDQYELSQTNMALNKELIEKNAELKRINENLEKMVQERTIDLELKNRALELSHAMLGDLPVPIIGVSADKMIVMVNRKAEELSIKGNRIEVGRDFSCFFGEDLEQHLVRAMEDNSPEHFRDYDIASHLYNIDFLPLSGRFRGKGLMVLFYLSDVSWLQADQGVNQESVGG